LFYVQWWRAVSWCMKCFYLQKHFYYKESAYFTSKFHLNVSHASLHKQLILHTLHIYKLDIKNISVWLSTITYKTHINIALCTMIQCCPRRCEVFLLGKNISMTNKMLMSELSFTCTHLMPNLHKQLILYKYTITNKTWKM
jgi:hypothetical protein